MKYSVEVFIGNIHEKFAVEKVIDIVGGRRVI